MSAEVTDHLDAECLFCQMVNGDIPIEVVDQNTGALAFRDIEPQAPSHVLVIPKRHLADVADMAVNDPDTCADVMTLAAEVGRSEGGHGGFRTVFNTGVQGGQLVFHCHAHILAGRQFHWPPG